MSQLVTSILNEAHHRATVKGNKAISGLIELARLG